MKTLAERYCIVHRQGFMPIFVSDSFDAVRLAEAAVAAGAAAVEITCRRKNVADEIRRVRKALPDLIIVVGSVVDDGPMLDFLRRRRPDMPSIAELASLGIDGVVSMMPLSLKTVAEYSATHIVIPGVETLTEAVQAVEAGAHFAKLFSTGPLGEHKRVATATCAATHGLPPIFVTGGVTLEKIEPYVAAGAAMLGSGWDMLLGEHYAQMQSKPDTAALTAALRRFLDEMAAARAKHLTMPTGGTQEEYLRAIPHYHPFSEA